MNLYDLMYELTDRCINKRTVFFGNVIFTKKSDEVRGVDYVVGLNTIHPNFISGGILKVGQYIKLEADDSSFYSKIFSIDSESSLTLESNYEGDGGAGNGICSNSSYPVIMSNQNKPAPGIQYIVLKEPPVVSLHQGPPCDDGMTDENGIKNTRIYHNLTIQIEEVGGAGELLKLFERGIYLPDNIRYCKNNTFSILKMEDEKDASGMLGGFIEKRVILDVNVEIADDFDYQTYAIKKVNFTGIYDE